MFRKFLQIWMGTSIMLCWNGQQKRCKRGQIVPWNYSDSRLGRKLSREAGKEEERQQKVLTSHSMHRYMESFTIITTQPKNIFSWFRGQLRHGCLKSHPQCGTEVHGGNHSAKKTKVFQFMCYIKQLNSQEEVGEWGHQGQLLHNCKRWCFHQGETFSMSLQLWEVNFN